MTISLPFITSAPGKVILFGEHSAVYNKPAIAASVSSLRTYLLISELNEPNTIELDFPDIEFSHKWNTNELLNLKPLHSHSNDEQLSELQKDQLEPFLSEISNKLHGHAAFCFLYLFVNICQDLHHTALKFTLRSTLPIGAGLGSSASISVALAMAMLELQDVIPRDKDQINKWSYIGEKCIHGNPSGIDNSVATHGGAIFFKKGEEFKQLRSKNKIDLILTDTRIPRSTKALVANVKALYDKEPKLIESILESMETVSLRGADALINGDNETLHTLVRINHGLLTSLGVSHPGLEKIKILSDELGIGETKLTGAGGGGCAFTILKAGYNTEQVRLFKQTLEKELNYKTFETDLGGIGCSLLKSNSLDKGMLEKILSVFQNKKTTSQEIDEILLPNSETKLPWIC
ncbi:hypothetical protein KAFR_0B03180 [Kazachstania africana CBS 2517]|uniref:Mevalonate kinase n=1 Tax=Kazachstania africana (strain ATCC 22294 / BCRC 22015 / CBS 2517 / CECT 1963 / NBRC 1671 / NRRL Y-8276) TaxID=1071382 RepID=H2AQG4_KAZAF|nr:hypothetical protein KAFR_0B03180 [Kazachstania africana CBS 2517]CCF56614.1 hypothetical protein KAFR_0B03180 [Kazachstania africana CBS 2517]